MRIVLKKKGKKDTSDYGLQVLSALRQFREKLPPNVRVKAASIYLTLECTDTSDKPVFLHEGSDYFEADDFEEMTLDENMDLVAVPDELVPNSRANGGRFSRYATDTVPHTIGIPMAVQPLTPTPAQQAKIDYEREEARQRAELLAWRKKQEDQKEAEKRLHLERLENDPIYRAAHEERKAAVLAKSKATREKTKAAKEADAGISP